MFKGFIGLNETVITMEPERQLEDNLKICNFQRHLRVYIKSCVTHTRVEVESLLHTQEWG